MEKFFDIYNKYRDYILFFFVLLFVICISFLFYFYISNNLSNIKEELHVKENEVVEQKEEVKEEIRVDIKGEVKKPGVYTLEKGKRVIDVVKKAGGFTAYADSSLNNLSKKIVDEMVIVIYSEEEINNYLDTREKESEVEKMCKNDIITNDSCVSFSSQKEALEDDEPEKEVTNNSEEKEDDNKLVSLTNATISELMTLPGIGESKAKAIIEYRKENSFKSIEDVKNVSGIGDALFEKIKDYITI